MKSAASALLAPLRWLYSLYYRWALRWKADS
jgi:hypothetical protein